MEAWSVFGSFLVGLAALGVLVWYATETMRLRKAAFAQVENMAKPCLTLWAKLRDPADVILNTHGAVGGTVIEAHGAQFVVHNIGNGLALNVKYVICDREPRRRAKNPRYLPYVQVRGRTQLPEPINNYGPDCEATFKYQSIGGQRYKSVVTMSHRVITDFLFTEDRESPLPPPVARAR